MSSLKEKLCCLVVLCVSVLPALPQQCNQFVIEPPVGPDMPLFIPEGGSATLTCRHISPLRRPAFAIQWFRDTTVIRPYDEADTSGECSCEVQPIDPIDTPIDERRELNFFDFAGMFAGEYSCRGPDNDTFSVEASCRFQVLLAVRPSIGEPLPQQNHTLEVGGTLSIPVVVTGVPPPTIITWRNSSTELSNSSRVTIDGSGGLTVTGVTLFDRGNYTLNVSNVDGSLIEWFSLFVPFVEITSISGPQANGSQISAECVVVGYPRPSVEWQDSSGNAVTSNIRTSTITNTYETVIRMTIIVDRFNCQPQRTYRCSASITARSSTTTTSIRSDLCNVPLPPPPPTNVMVVQNGPGSVLVTWEIARSNVDFTFEVCYTRVGGIEVCPGSGIPKTTREYVISSGLEVGVNYTFRVRSVSSLDRISSNGRTVTLSLGEQTICPDLTIANGVVGTSPPGRVFMSRTIYTCNDGFALKGDGNRVCQIDSMWNGTDPECVPILPPTPVLVQGLCSVVFWYSPEVPCSEVSGYDVRLYSPQSGQQNVTRRVGANGTFYVLKDEDILAGSGETYVQVRIIHSGREGEWSEGISLGCEKPTVSETPRVYFMLAEKVYRNNSVIPLTEVGEGDNALLCKTDKEKCCGTVPNRFGEFYYPNGVQVPIANRRQGFYRNRGDQIIRLNRREGITSSTGTYRCEIPNADDVIVTIYVTLTGN